MVDPGKTRTGFGGSRDPARSDRLARDLVAAGQGDREAFKRVYRASAGTLIAICLPITRDRGIAEDLVQDAFLKIWTKAGGYDPERARPMSWMGAIARNAAIDWYRSHNRAGAPRLAEPREMETVAYETEPVDSRMIRQETEAEAMRLVGELPADISDDIRTIYLHGLTYAEAADRDGVPIGTLKSRVRRALITLRARLGQ